MAQKSYIDKAGATKIVENIKAIESDIYTEIGKKADASHTHAIADVTGLQTKLNQLDNKVEYDTLYDLTASAGSSNGAVTIDLKSGGTSSAASKTDSIHINGSGATTVTTDTVGTITIDSTDTTYSAAGSSLGLVKSGGDVTISSGTITVNDDSHNHVIANVDGLQTALDGKAAASHSHDDLYYTESEIDSKLSGKADANTGTASTAGITKLYTGTGTATDGTMTQNAIKSALDGKVDKTQAGVSTAINLLSTGDSVPADNDYFISQYVNGGTTTTTYHRRPLSKLYEYIKGKLDSVYAASSHTHNYAGSSSAGGAATTALECTGNSATATKATSLNTVTTAGTGAAYTATVEGITGLTAGVNFIMIPHTVSTSVSPTLNVNGLGAKTLRQPLTNSTSSTTSAANTNWLGSNKPVRVTYNGTFWVADLVRPNASNLYGVTAIEHGGTGADNAADARVNLGIETPDGTTTSGNADYAEVGEWADGNTNDEDRIGYFVAIDNATAGKTMIKATSTSDVRGVTVAAPAFSGNCSSDKYGTSTITETDPETGEEVTTVVSTGELLKQYDYVAVMGMVSVIDNGTCTINGKCMPTDDGTAVPSPNNMGYQVIDRIDSTHILIAVEPSADMLVRIKEDVSEVQSYIADIAVITTAEMATLLS